MEGVGVGSGADARLARLVSPGVEGTSWEGENGKAGGGGWLLDTDCGGSPAGGATAVAAVPEKVVKIGAELKTCCRRRRQLKNLPLRLQCDPLPKSPVHRGHAAKHLHAHIPMISSCCCTVCVGNLSCTNGMPRASHYYRLNKARRCARVFGGIGMHVQVHVSCFPGVLRNIEDTADACLHVHIHRCTMLGIAAAILSTR